MTQRVVYDTEEEGNTEDMMSTVQDLVRQIVQAMVDNPAEVLVVEEKRGGGDVVLRITVADGDVSKVVGKKGRNISAIKKIVEAATVREWAKNRTGRYFVDLVEPKMRRLPSCA
jgi:hypothetical protein